MDDSLQICPNTFATVVSTLAAKPLHQFLCKWERICLI